MYLRASLVVLALLVACKHGPTEKQLQTAQIHYELGIQAQQGGDMQGAIRELQRALVLDPGMPEAHNAYAVLLHLSFNRPEQAIVEYKKAIEIRPEFSEAKVNLANVYLDQHR